MKLETIIETVVTVAVVVVCGFLVMEMTKTFLADGGMVWTFFDNIITSVCEKATELISGFTPSVTLP